MKKKLFLLIFFISTTSILYSNGSSGSNSIYETRFIIDMPNAGVIPKYAYNVNSRISGGGNFAIEFLAAPFDKTMIGVSYSSFNFIGEGEPEVQGIPGFDVRYRIKDETLNIPAFTLGIRTQGAGAWLKSYERFEILSPGIFLAVSKNFKWFLGELALHGGINYSFEAKPEDRFPNIYSGIEFTLGPFASGIAELNLNLDDANKKINHKKGNLNLGLRFAVTRAITLDIIFRDMLKHQVNRSTPERAINFEFISSF